MTTSQIKHTFFDALLIADAERIHSQTLGWILKLPEAVFTIESKSSFLNRLFNLENAISITYHFQVYTEVNQLDILLETDNYILIIENKLKSSEHTLQSLRYENSVPEKTKASGKPIKGAILSLISEKPKNENWQILSYGKLLECLSSIAWNDNLKETVFVKEYQQTLNNLVISFDAFIDNHKQFDSVFNDGVKSKQSKFRYDDEIKEYIRINQLETIFQKAFLRTIAEENELENYSIGESHGKALIQIFVTNIFFGETEYHLGFQSQGRSLKINLLLPKTKERHIMPVHLVESFRQSFSRKNGYKRFDKDKKNPYTSVSKTLPQPLYQMDKEEIGKAILNEITYIRGHSGNFEILLEQK